MNERFQIAFVHNVVVPARVREVLIEFARIHNVARPIGPPLQGIGQDVVIGQRNQAVTGKTSGQTEATADSE
jgi:hypothetical protein